MRNVMAEPAVGDRLADEFGYRWRVGCVEYGDNGRAMWICLEQIGGERAGEVWWMRWRDFVFGFGTATVIGNKKAV